MAKKRDFLVEIGTEEMPPRRLTTLISAFADHLQQGLDKAKLEHGDVLPFVTPRRLALVVKNLDDSQEPHVVERKGPSLKAAFDLEGNPTMACLGFAKACGVSVDQLETAKDQKRGWLVFRLKETGQSAQVLLPKIITAALNNLPIQKPMRWGNNDTPFVRPVHWVVMLYGEELISTELFGVGTAQETRGHRFLHPSPLYIKQASDYEKTLEKHGKVIADFTKRKEKIRRLASKVTREKGKVQIDEDLLDEVTGLVEWPEALLGEFDPRFLEIPPEVLISSMKTHQRCFYVVNEAGQLMPHFVSISNIKSRSPKHVVAGNERVICARLSDAEFFYHTDLKQPLENRLDDLKGVIFEKKLGSLFDRTKRISQLAFDIAKQVGVDGVKARRAGLLAKADLSSEMVGEFPALQGTMGYYYALKDKEPKDIAVAIRDHYKPRFAADMVPETKMGCVIALADRIDTLVGLFGINKPPTAEKDPFALRRAALGILRICIEHTLELDLVYLIQKALGQYKIKLENKQVEEQSLTFIMERLRAWYSDQGVSLHVFNAVFAKRPTRPIDFHRRIHAVEAFLKLPEAESLAIANKRVSNILIKQAPPELPKRVSASLFKEDAEKALATLLDQKKKDVLPLYKAGNYTKALTTLSTLRTPIDTFFDKVLVMEKDEKLRNNRLALLLKLRELFLHVADISLLQTGS